MDRFSRPPNLYLVRVAAAIVAVILVTTCARAPACEPGFGAPMILATLYFGLGLPDGGEVGSVSWQRFIATEVTPAFPDGLTITDATGQWRDPATRRIVAERTKVVTIVAAASPDLQARLDHIRTAYRSAFHQQSVGLTIAPVCASF